MPQAPWSQPPSLPPPPMLEVWLFERPIAALVVCLVAAALAFLILRRLERPRAALGVPLLLAALGAGAGAAGLLVHTAREQVFERSGQVVEAFLAADAARLTDLLAADLIVDAGGSGAGDGLGRDFVIQTAREVQGRFTIDAWRVRSPAAKDGPNAARTQVFVRTAGGAPSLTWWLFSWRKGRDDAWRAHTIELLLLNGKKPTMGIENMR